MQEFEVAGCEQMIALGKQISKVFVAGDMVWLEGNLGSGKTTLVQGVLAGLGYTEAVTSPTYTLLEPYSLASMHVVHMDLYRLKEAEELEMLGLRDFVDDSLCLVEWPDKGAGILPGCQWRIEIEVPSPDHRIVKLEQFS